MIQILQQAARRSYRAGLVLGVAVLLAVPPALAQETFSFQGKLTMPDGTPVPDATYSVRFQLFNDHSGGSPQWGEAHAVTTESGIFSVTLGTKTTLRLEAFEAMPYLLLIVDNEALAPRIPLTAVPYAMKSYRLDEQALRAGQNVSINRLSDGTLQIGSTGGGGSGLSSVATDATILGNGTSAAPLGIADGSVTGVKLANGALVAGQNVTVTRQSGGAFEVAATGGGGGLTQVASDGTLVGNGTAGSPLAIADGSLTSAKLADGAVTAPKLANGAVVAGQNVTVTRLAGGAFEVASAAGGLAVVASDATLSGDGTAGSPLAVQVPLSLTGGGAHVVRGEHSNGTYGWFGSGTVGAGGISSNGNIGYVGHTDFAVWGRNGNGNRGYLGSSDYGVYGESNSGGHGYIGSGSYGVIGESSNGNRGLIGGPLYGVRGSYTNGNLGILGTLNAGIHAQGVNGSAGVFNGDVEVSGTLSKGGGAFKIDHPLDPANKYLAHSFVESPDMMNVYNGNITTDANGEATVTLPDYFEALNRDFRYQLTTIGGFAPVYIAEEITGNTFRIAGGAPGMKVSWQVTGIRQDAWAEAHRIVVEEDKSTEEQGYYLHPKLFGQPAERNIPWARDPAMMREFQEQAATKTRRSEQQ